jgi:hypothetical protein
MKRHVHIRSNGIVVICRRPWCVRSLGRESVSRLVLLSVAFASAAAMSALGPKGLQAWIALLAVAALVVAGRILGARVERDARGSMSVTRPCRLVSVASPLAGDRGLQGPLSSQTSGRQEPA